MRRLIREALEKIKKEQGAKENDKGAEKINREQGLKNVWEKRSNGENVQGAESKDPPT